MHPSFFSRRLEAAIFKLDFLIYSMLEWKASN